MTRKDYELIAAAIRDARHRPNRTASTDLLTIILNLQASLGLDNPRFDNERFSKACLGGTRKEFDTTGFVGYNETTCDQIPVL